MPKRIPDKIKTSEQRLKVWIKLFHHAKMVRQAETLPLRRDMITLLTFVRDNKIIGTQSTGNMPLKAVRQVTAQFVKPPVLDTTIGDHVYRLRTEADVWPLYYLHILAEVGDLVAIAPARRWRLTTQGKKFIETDPLLQVTFLMTIWWYRVNWLVAYPLMGMGEALPEGFDLITLNQLRSLPTGKTISFPEFADRLIEKTGLIWAAKDMSSATMALHTSIERMIIDILANFGGAEREYKEKPLGKGTISELVAFEITPFGQAGLEAVSIVSG